MHTEKAYWRRGRFKLELFSGPFGHPLKTLTLTRKPLSPPPVMDRSPPTPSPPASPSSWAPFIYFIFFCVSSFLSHPIKICIEFNWHFIFLFSLSDFVCFDRKRSPENDSISASNSEKLVRTHLLLFGLHKKLLIFLDIPNNYV